MQVLCFPWATLIDLLRLQQHAKAKILLDALRNAPLRITLFRVTICQHIYMKDMLVFYKQLKITDVFWSHAVIGESFIDGICIHPFPLYPVCYADFITSNQTRLKPLNKRQYLYSFIGAYSRDLYITPVRQWLFDLPKRTDAIIKQRSEWHYEKHVYGEQILDITMTQKQLEQHQLSSQYYMEIMQDTIFCLCSSGSGPNSIRLWEALGFGCIPVILSDNIRLPGDAKLWEEATIKIPEVEASVKSIPTLLQNLNINNFVNPGATLWQHYGLNGFIYDIKNLSMH